MVAGYRARFNWQVFFLVLAKANWTILYCIVGQDELVRRCSRIIYMRATPLFLWEGWWGEGPTSCCLINGFLYMHEGLKCWDLRAVIITILQTVTSRPIMVFNMTQHLTPPLRTYIERPEADHPVPQNQHHSRSLPHQHTPSAPIHFISLPCFLKRREGDWGTVIQRDLAT